MSRVNFWVIYWVIYWVTYWVTSATCFASRRGNSSIACAAIRRIIQVSTRAPNPPPKKGMALPSREKKRSSTPRTSRKPTALLTIIRAAGGRGACPQPAQRAAGAADAGLRQHLVGARADKSEQDG